MFSVILGFLGLLVFILVIGSHSPLGFSANSSQVNTSQSVRVKQVQYQNSYLYQRDFIGQVEAKQISEAAFEISGMLKTIFFDEGNVVKQGDILAQLDTERLTARKNEAEAALTRAKADAKLAERTYQRFSELWQTKAVSSQERDEALEGRDITAAAVKVAEAQLKSILVDIEKSKLVAPFDGVVIKRQKHQGSVVNTGQTVMEIQQNSTYEIRMGVTTKASENLLVDEIEQVKIANKIYEARIISILPLRGQARTVDVILELKQHDESVRPGDVVRLALDYEVDQRGFWVPLNALVEGNRGLWSLYAIYQESNDLINAERRSVELHYYDGEQAFVSGTVKNGESIIIEGASKIIPGQAVNVLQVEAIGISDASQ